MGLSATFTTDTGQAGPEDLEEARRLGVADVVEKPRIIKMSMTKSSWPIREEPGHEVTVVNDAQGGLRLLRQQGADAELSRFSSLPLRGRLYGIIGVRSESS